jgi:hypothetical protein
VGSDEDEPGSLCAPLATGNNGNAAAPASKPPRMLNMLRREVRLAKPRSIFSVKRSN